MAKKDLSKSFEKLNKVKEHIYNQKTRANASKSDLDSIDESISKLKSEITSLGFEQQEVKIAELDKMLSKRSQLSLRVELLSGTNKEIKDNLKEALDQYHYDESRFTKEESDLDDEAKAAEKAYKEKLEDIRRRKDEIRDNKWQFKEEVKNILETSGLSKKDALAFCYDSKLFMSADEIMISFGR